MPTTSLPETLPSPSPVVCRTGRLSTASTENNVKFSTQVAQLEPSNFVLLEASPLVPAELLGYIIRFLLLASSYLETGILLLLSFNP